MPVAKKKTTTAASRKKTTATKAATKETAKDKKTTKAAVTKKSASSKAVTKTTARATASSKSATKTTAARRSSASTATKKPATTASKTKAKAASSKASTKTTKATTTKPAKASTAKTRSTAKASTTAEVSAATKPAAKSAVAKSTAPKKPKGKKLDVKKLLQEPEADHQGSGFMGIAPYQLSEDEPYMSEQQKAHFQLILLTWKRVLLEEVNRTVSHMKDEVINSPDISDRASLEEEFSLELKTRDRERKLIKKIDEALNSIQEDDYGYCNVCGIDIGIRRLEARPTATLCIDCKTMAEIKERQLRG